MHGSHALQRPSLILQNQEMVMSHQALQLEKAVLLYGVLLMESFEVSVVLLATNSSALPTLDTRRIQAKSGRLWSLQMVLSHH